MKKILAIILTCALCFSCTTSAFAVEDLDLRDKAINVLIESGWELSEIEDFLTDDALIEYANAIPVLTSGEKYFRVTETEMSEISEQECMAGVTQATMMLAQRRNELRNRALTNTISDASDEVITSDGYLKYNVELYAMGNNQFQLNARYEWLATPNECKIDVFGLGHDSNLTQIGNSSNVYYRYKADIMEINSTQTSTWVLEETSPTGIAVDPGGTVVKQDLQEDVYSGTYSLFATNHRGYIQYKVQLNNFNVNIVSVYSEYLHQQSTYQISPSISYPLGASISVSNSSSFNRMTPNPYISYNI